MYAVVIGVYSIVNHLLHYTVPQHQKYIVRILLMVPIYAIDSWFSLRFVEMGIFVHLLRSCYEAFVLYCFFNLLVNYLDGEDNIIAIFEAKPPIHHPWPFHRYTFQPSRMFYNQCKLFILQFVIVNLIVAFSVFFMSYLGVYNEGSFSPSSGYLWMMIVTNLSITFCLYYLILFWLALDDELVPFDPVGKFLCIKAVIFFSFWQGIFFAILVAAGVFKGGETWSPDNLSASIQDFIICIEMYFLSIAFIYSFHWGPYENPCVTGLSELYKLKPMMRSGADVLNLQDTIQDTKDTFHPDNLAETFDVVGSGRKHVERAADQLKRISNTFVTPESPQPNE